MNRFVQVSAGIVLAVSGAGLIGYVFGINYLYTISPTPMALNTAICFTLVAFALLALGKRIH